ncbi:hypothetical protein [Anabaena sp. PCC 7108]|uniref:hypothetical protein n=1 Tax=Anabaena sp. PCC 7108 TaxID=163908 RepID=UPI0003487495|nr:hypothetical protein [Anabaena sp. PCC 7108]
MNIDDEIQAFLQECINDGEQAKKLPFLLGGFLKALAAQQNSGEIYRLSQDAAFLEKKVSEFNNR